MRTSRKLAHALLALFALAVINILLIGDTSSVLQRLHR